MLSQVCRSQPGVHLPGDSPARCHGTVLQMWSWAGQLLGSTVTLAY